MAKIVLYMSMSLDGFIAGPGDDAQHGLGRGGERLHDWLADGNGGPASYRPDGPSAEVFDELMATGAVIAGHRQDEPALRAPPPRGGPWVLGTRRRGRGVRA
jgi:hypothetical protein